MCFFGVTNEGVIKTLKIQRFWAEVVKYRFDLKLKITKMSNISTIRL